MVHILFLLFVFSLSLSLSSFWQDLKVDDSDDDPAVEVENSDTSKTEGVPLNRVEEVCKDIIVVHSFT